MSKHRNPYVGEGADGARRSAQIDREEADGLTRGTARWEAVMESAEEWDQQADELDKLELAEAWVDTQHGDAPEPPDADDETLVGLDAFKVMTVESLEPDTVQITDGNGEVVATFPHVTVPRDKIAPVPPSPGEIVREGIRQQLREQDRALGLLHSPAGKGWPYPPRPDEVDDPLALAAALYSAGRRDTPTGTIIGRLDPLADRAQWLELRRTGIGSSDVPHLLGLTSGQYAKSELDLYMDKRGELPADESGEAAMWGNILEQPVAAEWARRAGVKVRRVGTIAHVEHRHMLCDLDRYVIGCPDHERCAVEVKTRSAYKADAWKEGVPDDTEAQVMHQLAVTGLDAIHVAALIGGQTLKAYVVEPDADMIADLFAIEDQFWNENVLAGVVPEISSLELLEAHLKRFTPDKGTPVHVHGAEALKAHQLAVEYDELKAGEKRLEEVKRELYALIGPDGTDLVAVADDGAETPLVTWRSQNAAAQIDRDAMRADGVYDRYLKPAGTTRVLRRVKPKEGKS